MTLVKVCTIRIIKTGQKQKHIGNHFLKTILTKHGCKRQCVYVLAKCIVDRHNNMHFFFWNQMWKNKSPCFTIWIFFKSPVGRLTVAYNCFLTPTSIFVGFFKEFYVKFDSILKDSLSLVQILGKTKLNINCFDEVKGVFH